MLASGRSIGTIGPRDENVQRTRLCVEDLFGDAIIALDQRQSAAWPRRFPPNATNLAIRSHRISQSTVAKALGTVLTTRPMRYMPTAMAANGADALHTGPIARMLAPGSRRRRLRTTVPMTRAKQPRRLAGEETTRPTSMRAYVCGMRHHIRRHHGRIGARHSREFQPRAAKPTAIDFGSGGPTVLAVKGERGGVSADRDVCCRHRFRSAAGRDVGTLLNKPFCKPRRRSTAPHRRGTSAQ